MAAVGAVYVNASLTLLNQGPSAGTLWFNLLVPSSQQWPSIPC